MGTQVLSCLRILRNTIIIKRRPRTPTNIYDGTPCDNSIRLWAVKCIVTNSSIFAVGRGTGSASTKVRFLEDLKFLLQSNKKLLLGKYHSRIWLWNTANTQNRAFFRNISPLKSVKFRLKKTHLSTDIERSPRSSSTEIYTI